MIVSLAQAQWTSYQFTIEDPTFFADWNVGNSLMTRTATQKYEYACHAGDSSLKLPELRTQSLVSGKASGKFSPAQGSGDPALGIFNSQFE